MELSISYLLKTVIERGASDLHIAVGDPPLLRIDGDLFPISDTPPLNPSQSKELAYSLLTEQQIKTFEAEKELDVGLEIKGLSRFRINLYLDKGSVACAIRPVPFRIPSFEELGIPQAVIDMAEKPKGLILICGPTGNGKSTTLAALINKINEERRCHIITLEDPIEFVHAHKQSLVNQRELHSDTYSFPQALKHILRQDPDVILIGEMRDLETIQSALTIAETGHLVFSTLHTQDATQCITRIVDVFPAHQQEQVRLQLSFVLEGVAIQQLLPRADGRGRCLAMELLIPTPAVRNLIREDKLAQIYTALSTGGSFGMKTMNLSLFELYNKKLITYEVAFERSTDREDLLRLMEKGY